METKNLPHRQNNNTLIIILNTVEIFLLVILIVFSVINNYKNILQTTTTLVTTETLSTTTAATTTATTTTAATTTAATTQPIVHLHVWNNYKCDECGEYDEEYCEPIYEKILGEMSSMDSRSDNLDRIDEYIDQLPAGYKDISRIKSESNAIRSYFNVFLTQIYNAKKSENVDYDLIQSTYFDFLDQTNTYPSWNISNAAYSWFIDWVENEISGKGDITMLAGVLKGNWDNSSGYYINIIETEENSIRMGCNIPNDKEISADIDYYFFIKGNQIGYMPTNNTNKLIYSYRVDEITREYTKIYCYKNQITYKLYRQS